MFRSTLRRVMGGKERPSTLLPYDMFDRLRTNQEVDSARKMERIYHQGQERAWAGVDVLSELLKRHNGVQISPEKVAPLGRLFSVIFWGELAAWKVSAALALEIPELEAKMAATSQAHDEARHFYVMHDYLEQLGYRPGELPRPATILLERVIGAPSLAKKLLGMQLMVEPIALTLFQLIRSSNVEPVLCDLLPYYERDEARHVALGVQYLPVLFEKMSRPQLAELWAWQLRMFLIEIRGLQVLEGDLRSLGFHPREAMKLGQAKQFHAINLMAERMGRDLPVLDIFRRVIECKMELDFPMDGEDTSWSTRLRRAITAMLRDAEMDHFEPGMRVDEVFSADFFAP